MQSLTADKVTDYSLWKTTKNLKRPTVHNPPIKNDNGLWAKSDADKSEVFATHLQKTFQPFDLIGDFNAPLTVQESNDLLQRI